MAADLQAACQGLFPEESGSLPGTSEPREVQFAFSGCLAVHSAVCHAWAIFADPARLHQVLWNVLRNAIKFTPAGGFISVTSRRSSAGRCVVAVRDSGIGIPAEVLPLIFNAFEQGEARITRQIGGLGLGLAISRALVDLHGGSIRAESPGTRQGSTFIAPSVPIPLLRLAHCKNPPSSTPCRNGASGSSSSKIMRTQPVPWDVCCGTADWRSSQRLPCPKR